MSFVHHLHLVIIRTGKSTPRLILELLAILAVVAVCGIFTRWLAPFCLIFLLC